MNFLLASLGSGLIQPDTSYSLPPSMMSVPRPAMFVATVTAPLRPASATIEASRSWCLALRTSCLTPALRKAFDSTSDFSTETVPTSVTMRQARLALLAAGKLAAVQSAIDALSEPTKTAAQIEWEYSNEVQRHNGLVAALGPALSLTSDQIDALFIGAAKL